MRCFGRFLGVVGLAVVSAGLFILGPFGPLGQRAGVEAITLWLPDGRAVMVPKRSREFADLALVTGRITPFTNAVAAQAMMASIRWGALRPPWAVNPDAVVLEVRYTRGYTGGMGGGAASRLCFGSGSTRLPERDLVIAAGLWIGGHWLQVPLDKTRTDSHLPSLGAAVERALDRYPPSPQPVIATPRNVSVEVNGREAVTEVLTSLELWEAVYRYVHSHYFGASALARNNWREAEQPPERGEATWVRVSFREALADDPSGLPEGRAVILPCVLAINFLARPGWGRGQVWLETDDGPRRFHLDYIMWPLADEPPEWRLAGE